MGASPLESIVQQIDDLGPEEKWTLLELLIDRLRRQARPSRGRLSDYYGIGRGRIFRTAQEVDTFIEEERNAWEE
jgi:hypothetical protein